MANYKAWEVKQIDVESAFLNAELKEDVYLKQPKGYEMEEGKVLKLNRALYGLVQAPKAWMETFIKQVEILGYKRSWTDPCLMTKSNRGEVILCMTIYADDCLIAGKEEDVEETIQGIEKIFKVKRMGDAGTYLGYTISRDRKKGTLSIHQTDYIESIQETYNVGTSKAIRTLAKVGKEPSKDTEDTNVEVDLTEYKSGVGALLYAMKTTRPDIANAVRLLSKHMDKAKSFHMDGMYRVMQYLIGTKALGITYDNKRKMELEAYVDSDYAGDTHERKSTSGYVVMLGGGAIQWKSKLQDTVSLSSSEAEYKALSTCAAEISYLKRVLSDVGFIQNTVKMYEDNIGAMKLAESWESTRRTKHIDIRFHNIREMIENEEITLKHIKSKDQPADILTKNLPVTTFEKHKRFLMNLV